MFSLDIWWLDFSFPLELMFFKEKTTKKNNEPQLNSQNKLA